VFEAQRKIVMGARLMVVHGVMQRDEDIIHVVVRKLEDGTHMLRHLSDGLMPSTLNQGDGGGSWRPPVGRHPRDVSVIPKSRDFH
jgi:error-prone DNA polymerase